MRPKKQKPRDSDDLFRNRLDNILDRRHGLFRLAELTNWEGSDRAFGRFYRELGRPGKPTRLMVELSYRKHVYDLSDEDVVGRWVENPHWQWFCGFEWLMRMLAHRIADPRILRLIERWLKAGILESGRWQAVAGGRQGNASRIENQPAPGHVFLHYVFDL